MYDLSQEELKILDMLTQGLSEEEIARSLNISTQTYRERWKSLANKFEWHEPKTLLGKTQALIFERSKTASLMAALHTAHTRLFALMGLSPNAIMIVDGYSGSIRQCNDNCEILFGYPIAELQGMDVEQLIDPGLTDKHIGLRRGFLKSVRKREIGYHPPIVAIRKDGAQVEIVIGLTSTTSTDEVMVICTEAAVALGGEAGRYLKGTAISSTPSL